MDTHRLDWKPIAGWACLILIAAGCAAGCGDPPSLVRIVDVPDGTYLRGIQNARLEVDPGLELVRSELYLDGSRIAADDFAPFELAWDTRAFDDGAYALMARVYLSNGDHIDGATAIWVDNTPPAVGTIRLTATGSQPFPLDVSDNLKVAEVDVTRDVPGEPPVILTSAPFTFPWRWGCGPSTIRIRVVDAAGGEASATATVIAIDANDHDCDGFTSIVAGGGDCNDDNVTAHPGAREPPEGFDLNCDGTVAPLDGVDSDGDGVPSLSDGGNDCDDTDPTIHGVYYRFAHVALNVGGVPVTWNPGDAALQASPGFWSLFLNRGGLVEQFTAGSGGDIFARQIATGANPSSLSVGNGRVAFGRGNEVVILRQDANGWVEHAVIPAGGPVGRLLVDHQSGVDFTVFQTGTDMWFASTPDGSSSTIVHIDDLHDPLVQNPAGYTFPPVSSYVFRTSRGALRYTRSEGEAFRQAGRVGLANLTPTAMTTSPGPAFIAVSDGTGAAIYSEGLPEPLLRTSRPVTAMTVNYPSVFLQLDGGGLEVVALTRNSSAVRHTQTIPDITTFDAADYGGFAGGGFVHYLTADTVFAPDDIVDDHVDRDCNEHD